MPSSPLILLAIEDVTARRQLEAASRQRLVELVAADRSKDEFLAMLGHELRNPLGSLRNAVQLVRLPKADSATVSRAWAVMDRQLKSLTRLVDDLLDVARMTQGRIGVQTEMIELATVIGRAVEAIEPSVAARAQELVVSLSTETVHVEVDPIRMEQVFANLLHNASKFTARGGHIWVTVEGPTREGPTAPDVVLVRVRDDGIGIDPELLPLVFDMFAQADHSLARSQGGSASA